MDFQENQIFVMKAAPYEWQNLAEEIKTSMDYLLEKENWGKIISKSDIEDYQEKSPISRTWFLLAGFAVENLLKGLLIAQNPSYISNGTLSRILRNHRLISLANQIDKIQFSSDEIKMISLLEKCIPSWGRYPIPINMEDLKNEEILNASYKLIFEDLFFKLHNQIEEILSQVWKGPHGCTLSKHIVETLYPKSDS